MFLLCVPQAWRRQNGSELRIRCPILSLPPFSSIFKPQLCFLIDSLSRTLQEWSDTMIINQLTFLMLLCLPGWSGALIRPVPGISTSDRDGRTLHRTKRGWMWNSFFLLEEWTGTGKQYVGKVRAISVLKKEKKESRELFKKWTCTLKYCYILRNNSSYHTHRERCWIYTFRNLFIQSNLALKATRCLLIVYAFPANPWPCVASNTSAVLTLKKSKHGKTWTTGRFECESQASDERIADDAFRMITNDVLEQNQ